MSLKKLASTASAWRGYEYYKCGKVLECKAEGADAFAGSGSVRYSVTINVAHPKTSKCDCPHAD